MTILKRHHRNLRKPNLFLFPDLRIFSNLGVATCVQQFKKNILFFVSSILVIGLSSNSFAANALKNNPSQYLAMHAKDPVNWQPWSKKVLQQAQKQNRLIMISSGYFSCHWCHVMQHENYQNKQIAVYLNQHFISVKIDRELMPGVDAYLIAFAQKAAGHAGWPQHVFLTPNGYPFFALTYQPHEQFLKTLKRIENLWQTQSEKIISTAKGAITDQPTAKRPDARFNETAFKNRFYDQLHNQQDMLEGGLKSANKFPNTPILLALLQQTQLSEDTMDWLKLTLDQIQSENLQDHINGGFFRYAIDPAWQTPHFEKMLYTQALLANAYFLAANRFQRPDYLQTAIVTLDYVKRHLYNPKTGLFVSSESAIDQNNQEGGAYLWTREALKKSLTIDEFKQIEKDWQLNQPAPFTLDNHDAAWLPKPTSNLWLKLRQALQRPLNRFPKDMKSVMGWNGLMLSAYAQAVANQPNHSTYRKLADQLATKLISVMQQPKPPRALSSDNHDMGSANLSDYVYVIQGLQDWQQVSDNDFSKAIQNLIRQTKTHFLTQQGWHLSNSPTLPGQTGTWAISDSALPSPTAILSCQTSLKIPTPTSQLSASPLDYASYLLCKGAK